LQVAQNERMTGIPRVGRDASELIVFNIDTDGMAAPFLIAFPMVANAIRYKFKVLIEKRFNLAEGRRMNTAANRQSAREVVPVGRRRARREHFTEHCNVLVGVEKFAQDIGAGSLSADHHKQLTAGNRGIGVSVTQGSHRLPPQQHQKSRESTLGEVPICKFLVLSGAASSFESRHADLSSVTSL
jgi:hypothetical protein